MIHRRAVVAGLGTSVFTVPRVARGQASGKVYRIGILNLSDPAVFRPQISLWDRAIAQGLQERGYVVGENLIVEVRTAEGQMDRLPAVAADLVALQPDVIVADSTPKVQALLKLTKTIPIVFYAVADPVRDGLIASFARPGGNATGLSTIASELSAKRLELLRELVPRVTRLGTIRYPGYTQAGRAQASTEEVARPLGVQIHPLEAREGEYESALSAMSRERVGAVILLPHPIYFRDMKQIADLAVKYRLPTIYEYADYPAAGGLISYGPNLVDLARRATGYIDRILRGAKPGDLPVEQPRKFDLVINLKTAKALGLTIPPSVLARADEVIQ